MGEARAAVPRLTFDPISGQVGLALVRAKSRFSPLARDYFARLDAAGIRIRAADSANAYLIDALNDLGALDDGTVNAMAGYLFPGSTLIPLVDGMDAGTDAGENAWVAGDWNVKTGCKGDAAGKAWDSHRSGAAEPRNDSVVGIYVTEANTSADRYFGASLTDLMNRRGGTDPADVTVRCRENGTRAIGIGEPTTGYRALGRESAAQFYVYSDGSRHTDNRDSVEPNDISYWFFAGNPEEISASYGDSRMSLYHIGRSTVHVPETVDAIVTEWMSQLNAAL